MKNRTLTNNFYYRHLQKLKSINNDLRESFTLSFFARMKSEQKLAQNNLQIDIADFFMCRTFRIHNCSIWFAEYRQQIQQITCIHLMLFMDRVQLEFCNWAIFFEKKHTSYTTCFVTAAHYWSMLQDTFILKLQQRE